MEMNLRSDGRTAEPAAARNAPGPVIEFLLRHAPFDRMAPVRLESLPRHLKRGFHVNDPIIVDSTRTAADRLYIIKLGRVRGGQTMRKDWRTHLRIPPLAALGFPTRRTTALWRLVTSGHVGRSAITDTNNAHRDRGGNPFHLNWRKM